MQDKRCKYKIRECKDFYLFIKHKESHIYYAKFPEYNKIASTGKTNIKQAYQEAYRIYGSLGIATTPFHELLLNTYKDSYYKTYNMAKKLSALLSDIKTLEQVTLPTDFLSANEKKEETAPVYCLTVEADRPAFLNE